MGRSGKREMWGDEVLGQNLCLLRFQHKNFHYFAEGNK